MKVQYIDKKKCIRMSLYPIDKLITWLIEDNSCHCHILFFNFVPRIYISDQLDGVYVLLQNIVSRSFPEILFKQTRTKLRSERPKGNNWLCWAKKTPVTEKFRLCSVLRVSTSNGRQFNFSLYSQTSDVRGFCF